MARILAGRCEKEVATTCASRPRHGTPGTAASSPVSGPENGAGSGLQDHTLHQLAPYRSLGEFVALAGPFLREGLDRGDRVVVATGSAAREALRQFLGQDGREVRFAEVHEWYRGLVLPSAERSVSAPRAPLWLVGEPPLNRMTGVVRREWMRCEAATNLALPWVQARIVCGYDFSRLDEAAAGALMATHPALRRGGSAQPNPHYVEPRDFAADSDRVALEPPPASAIQFPFDLQSYAHTRRLAAETASRVGLSEQQECDLGLAVTELATNAVRHGGGAGVLRVWTEGRAVVGEVSDRGPGLPDPLAGYIQPRAGTATSGWGMWLVRRVCDVVEVRTGPRGTTIRMRIEPGGVPYGGATAQQQMSRSRGSS
jgi:anti-sigma regulatory factor (Ser/Thr protein kinase)